MESLLFSNTSIWLPQNFQGYVLCLLVTRTDDTIEEESDSIHILVHFQVSCFSSLWKIRKWFSPYQRFYKNVAFLLAVHIHPVWPSTGPFTLQAFHFICLGTLSPFTLQACAFHLLGNTFSSSFCISFLLVSLLSFQTYQMNCFF